jgi:hypothetical protein
MLHAPWHLSRTHSVLLTAIRLPPCIRKKVILWVPTTLVSTPHPRSPYCLNANPSLHAMTVHVKSPSLGLCALAPRSHCIDIGVESLHAPYAVPWTISTSDGPTRLIVGRATAPAATAWSGDGSRHSVLETLQYAVPSSSVHVRECCEHNTCTRRSCHTHCTAPHMAILVLLARL